MEIEGVPENVRKGLTKKKTKVSPLPPWSHCKVKSGEIKCNAAPSRPSEIGAILVNQEVVHVLIVYALWRQASRLSHLF